MWNLLRNPNLKEHNMHIKIGTKVFEFGRVGDEFEISIRYTCPPKTKGISVSITGGTGEFSVNSFNSDYLAVIAGSPEIRLNIPYGEVSELIKCIETLAR